MALTELDLDAWISRKRELVSRAPPPLVSAPDHRRPTSPSPPRTASSNREEVCGLISAAAPPAAARRRPAHPPDLPDQLLPSPPGVPAVRSPAAIPSSHSSVCALIPEVRVARARVVAAGSAPKGEHGLRRAETLQQVRWQPPDPFAFRFVVAVVGSRLRLKITYGLIVQGPKPLQKSNCHFRSVFRRNPPIERVFDSEFIRRCLVVTWMPYTKDVLIGLSAFCLEGSAIWRSRTSLICFHIVELHLPDRVLHQFGLLQHIPEVVEVIQRITSQGRSGEDWAAFHAPYIQRWADRLKHIAEQSPFVDPDPIRASFVYMQWYWEITRRWISRLVQRPPLTFLPRGNVERRLWRRMKSLGLEQEQQRNM
ncbi:Serine/threonine-protein phosphatase [Ananas comosus]|uniref:Serine/threonine-protein phosphatase n=1 Tax=Ananas comosus TaxID=4615 RepID=A0A199W4G4_ANACO|nr:Serine/threonine-protein phosphatase [Ananas comosus]